MAPTADVEHQGADTDQRDPRVWHALYELKDVRVALGRHSADDEWLEPASGSDSGGLGASRDRMRKLLDQGEAYRWRRLANATEDAVAGVKALGARAPHLRDMTDLVTRRLQAAIATGTRIALPPTLLLGPPGVGKSWYMAHLAQLLGVPFRLYPMNLSTLSDGLSGSHPCWRGAAWLPGPLDGPAAIAARPFDEATPRGACTNERGRSGRLASAQSLFASGP